MSEVPFRSEILLTANNLINGDRNKQYGTPQENFRVTAEYWSTYLGVKIEAHDVCNLMALLKIARTKTGFKDDTYIDAAGYLALAGELHQDAAERGPIPECTRPGAVGQADGVESGSGQ